MSGEINDIRICFLGDSFVNGTGDEKCLGWAGRLCASAIDSGNPITYYNLGIRRNTSRDILLRWEGECLPRLPEGCDGRIVLSCGVNDTVIEEGRRRVSLEESRENIRRILDATGLSYRVIMVGPPPVVDPEHNKRILEIDQIFSQEAGALGVPFIETFSSLANDEAYRNEIQTNDGAHPRSSGYAKLARLIASSKYWWF